MNDNAVSVDLRKLIEKFPHDGKEFKPYVTHFPNLDMIQYLERECDYVSKRAVTSNIVILCDAVDLSKIIGIEIWNFSKLDIDKADEIMNLFNVAEKD